MLPGDSTRQRSGWDLNRRPTDRKSGRHPIHSATLGRYQNMLPGNKGSVCACVNDLPRVVVRPLNDERNARRLATVPHN